MNIRSVVIGCAFVCACELGNSSSASEVPPVLGTSPERHWPGFTRGGAGFWDVDVEGAYAYVSGLKPELVVFDVHDPTNPVPVGSYSTGATIRDTQVKGEVAYVSNDRGLLALDVRDPAAIRRLGSYDYGSFGGASAMHVAGDHAYLARSRLEIVDVSDPQRMNRVGEFIARDFISAVFAAGNRAYIGETNAIRVLDVSNPARPAELGRFPIPARAWDIQVVGSRAYVANVGLEILDVSDPQNIARLGATAVGTYAMKLHIVGDLAYIGGPWEGLRVADISDPANIVLIPVVPEIRTAQGVFGLGDHVYVAVGGGFRTNPGLWTFAQQSDPRRFVLAGGISTAGQATSLQVVGSHVYLADAEAGFSVFDLEAEPMLLRTIPGSAVDVDVQGSRAYVSGNNGLRIFDVTDPGVPTLIGQYNTNGVAPDVDVIGNRAYLAAGHRGLEILDVSDPGNIVLLKSGAVWGPASAVEVHSSGDYAYVVRNGAVTVLQIADPGPIDFRTAFWDGHDIQVIGNRLYALDALQFRIYDVSHPFQPQFLGIFVGREMQAFHVSGNRAYIAEGANGFSVVDVSDPGNMRLLGRRDTRGFARYVDGGPNVICVADGQGGLLALPSMRGVQFTLSVTAAPVIPLTIEASPDLTGWAPIFTTTANVTPVKFTDSNVVVHQKFYRARQP